MKEEIKKNEVFEKKIKLIDDGEIYNIEVIM